MSVNTILFVALRFREQLSIYNYCVCVNQITSKTLIVFSTNSCQIVVLRFSYRHSWKCAFASSRKIHSRLMISCFFFRVRELSFLTWRRRSNSWSFMIENRIAHVIFFFSFLDYWSCWLININRVMIEIYQLTSSFINEN
jgi:hypothetical protein